MAGENDWNRDLQSPHPEVRIRAAEMLYKDMRDVLFRLFLAKAGSEEEAEEFVQATFERFCLALLKAPLKDNSNPKGYVYTITSNLWKDWLRERKQASLLAERLLNEHLVNHHLRSQSVEEKVQQNWSQHRLRSLCWQLADEKAHITLLLFLAGLSTRQISWLVPWSESTVDRYIRDNRHIFTYLFDQAPVYETEPGTWDRLLAYPDRPGELGVAFINAAPRNFSKQTELDLCRQLGLSHIEQLLHRYRSFIVIRRAYSADSQVRLCFAPRESMGLGLLRGNPLDYVYDGFPLFCPDAGDGKKNEKLHLVGVTRYRAWVVGINDEDPCGIALVDWHYDISEGPLHIRKILNPAVFERKTADLPSLAYFSSRPVSTDCCRGSQPTSFRASS